MTEMAESRVTEEKAQVELVCNHSSFCPDLKPALKQLTIILSAANADGDHVMAHSFFESAYNAKDDVASLISATNMRLKLGQMSLAAAVYEQASGMFAGCSFYFCVL